ncbi:chromosome-associated kinesin KIF4A-like [Saccostrea cucullata]|uniref:chromosome-associated kinesin KIF4A-like n=1 Tax=Saccostrea cuccullata TaxID=36930 RepID=UPI002ED32A5B
MPESVPIKVCGRCRPLTQEEATKGVKSVVKSSGDKLLIESGGKEHSFSFDGAYANDVRNEQIYKERCEPILQRALEGFNVSIIALGSTNAGKTYLMSGTEGDPGIAPCFIRNLYQAIGERSNKEFFITVSYLEVLDEKMSDLLNPHVNQMKIRHHPHKGIFIEGLSEMVVHNWEEMSQLYEQGTRVRKMGANDIRANQARAHSVFTITVEQRTRQSSKVGVRSVICLADLAMGEAGGTSDTHIVAGLQGLMNVLSALGGPKKGSNIPYRDSTITRVLQDSFGGNTVTLMFAVVSPVDKAHKESLTTLQYASYAKSAKNHVKANLDETAEIIADLREEIAKLRDKIAATSAPSRDDVHKLEDLVQDLQIAKMSTWAEREKLSKKFEEERKVNLANKGILDWVMDNMKKGNKEIQEKMLLLQKEKDQVTSQYTEKRRVVDGLNEELQKKIAEYSKYQDSGKLTDSETKKRVTAIHEIKEKLRKESEGLKQIKSQLRDLAEKQKEERDEVNSQMSALKGSTELRQQVEKEERLRVEKENRAMIADEVEKMKTELETEKSHIQLKVTENKSHSAQEVAQLEIQLAEMKLEKPVTTMKIQLLEQEKERLIKELDAVYQVHKDELEFQRLHHLETFRTYREMFEEQKAALDQRYRHLLEDAIQDAVFLSSRNNELQEESQSLRQQNAEMRDSITKLGGRLPSQIA